jgi:SAM-dependent methyltransferase
MLTSNIRERKFLSEPDFELAFGEKLSSYVVTKIKQYNFEYEDFSPTEHEELLIKIIDTLLDPQLMKSGEHRLSQWEDGWAENLQSFLANPSDIEQIVPKYFNKYGAVRWQAKFIRPKAEKFEWHSLSIILDWLFDKYCRQASNIYEFGCGTGHNLLRLRQVNADAQLWGLDWATASQQILQSLSDHGIDKFIHGHRFDYFNPDKDFSLAPNSVLYTVASLEQIGNRWKSFLDYVMQNRPALCIHVEPIEELLDQNGLLDNLSLKYFHKRNYLSGYLRGLHHLEQSGRIRIHKEHRTRIGSLFIEGYSVVVWSPL